MEARGGQDTTPRREPAAQAPVALHPSLRGLVDGSEPALLRRTPDGPGVPAHVRPNPARPQGHGEPLDAARADVGCRAGAPCRPGVLSLAEHGALLRIDLAESLEAIAVARALHDALHQARNCRCSSLGTWPCFPRARGS